MLPLQFIDGILLEFTLGEVLLITFVLSVLATLPLKSQKIVGLVVTTFGAIFLLSPEMSATMLLLGVALAIAGPIVFATARS
ncbi:hypothetical protein [Natronocalculus amylovorans]|uniref:DUF8006 domain-containing protein n=1 Tax=Natronocalculus amylovorans TaxID=2917812 RepID=A0AAE3K8J4_9EURY|nr:hypothetical protein [Natronocalculus amylovorans]MCL9816580.1 hypothetical protein [Natronocalculus amylovorans]NUE01025.1 hypothetical protein [Halorubraceae archaeon YAN]